MQKINFQDLPSTTTPINANNLNQLQTNIDDAKYELTRGTAINENDDLNNYKSVGSFYANSNSVAASLSHCPTVYSFKLVVENTNNSSNIRQIIYTRDITSLMWVRTLNGSTWGDWNKVLFEDDTGWVDISSYLNTDYFSTRTGYEPKVRKIGNVIYYRGEVYCHTAPNSNMVGLFSNIPSQFRYPNQHTGGGVTYRGIPYDLWAYAGTITVRTLDNIAVQTSASGFSLSSLSGGLVD